MTTLLNVPVGKSNPNRGYVRNLTDPQLTNFLEDKSPFIYSTFSKDGRLPLVLGYGMEAYPPGRNEFDLQLLSEEQRLGARKHQEDMERQRQVCIQELLALRGEKHRGGRGGQKSGHPVPRSTNAGSGGGGRGRGSATNRKPHPLHGAHRKEEARDAEEEEEVEEEEEGKGEGYEDIPFPSENTVPDGASAKASRRRSSASSAYRNKPVVIISPAIYDPPIPLNRVTYPIVVGKENPKEGPWVDSHRRPSPEKDDGPTSGRSSGRKEGKAWIHSSHEAQEEDEEVDVLSSVKWMGPFTAPSSPTAPSTITTMLPQQSCSSLCPSPTSTNRPFASPSLHGGSVRSSVAPTGSASTCTPYNGTSNSSGMKVMDGQKERRSQFEDRRASTPQDSVYLLLCQGLTQEHLLATAGVLSPPYAHVEARDTWFTPSSTIKATAIHTCGEGDFNVPSSPVSPRKKETERNAGNGWPTSSTSKGEGSMAMQALMRCHPEQAWKQHNSFVASCALLGMTSRRTSYRPACANQSHRTKGTSRSMGRAAAVATMASSDGTSTHVAPRSPLLAPPKRKQVRSEHVEFASTKIFSSSAIHMSHGRSETSTEREVTTRSSMREKRPCTTSPPPTVGMAMQESFTTSPPSFPSFVPPAHAYPAAGYHKDRYPEAETTSATTPKKRLEEGEEAMMEWKKERSSMPSTEMEGPFSIHHGLPRNHREEEHPANAVESTWRDRTAWGQMRSLGSGEKGIHDLSASMHASPPSSSTSTFLLSQKPVPLLSPSLCYAPPPSSASVSRTPAATSPAAGHRRGPPPITNMATRRARYRAQAKKPSPSKRGRIKERQGSSSITCSPSRKHRGKHGHVRSSSSSSSCSSSSSSTSSPLPTARLGSTAVVSFVNGQKRGNRREKEKHWRSGRADVGVGEHKVISVPSAGPSLTSCLSPSPSLTALSTGETWHRQGEEAVEEEVEVKNRGGVIAIPAPRADGSHLPHPLARVAARVPRCTFRPLHHVRPTSPEEEEVAEATQRRNPCRSGTRPRKAPFHRSSPRHQKHASHGDRSARGRKVTPSFSLSPSVASYPSAASFPSSSRGSHSPSSAAPAPLSVGVLLCRQHALQTLAAAAMEAANVTEGNGQAVEWNTRGRTAVTARTGSMTPPSFSLTRSSSHVAAQSSQRNRSFYSPPSSGEISPFAISTTSHAVVVPTPPTRNSSRPPPSSFMPEFQLKHMTLNATMHPVMEEKGGALHSDDTMGWSMVAPPAATGYPAATMPFRGPHPSHRHASHTALEEGRDPPQTERPATAPLFLSSAPKRHDHWKIMSHPFRSDKKTTHTAWDASSSPSLSYFTPASEKKRSQYPHSPSPLVEDYHGSSSSSSFSSCRDTSRTPSPPVMNDYPYGMTGDKKDPSPTLHPCSSPFVASSSVVISSSLPVEREGRGGQCTSMGSASFIPPTRPQSLSHSVLQSQRSLLVEKNSAHQYALLSPSHSRVPTPLRSSSRTEDSPRRELQPRPTSFSESHAPSLVLPPGTSSFSQPLLQCAIESSSVYCVSYTIARRTDAVAQLHDYDSPAIHSRGKDGAAHTSFATTSGGGDRVPSRSPTPVEKMEDEESKEGRKSLLSTSGVAPAVMEKQQKSNPVDRQRPPRHEQYSSAPTSTTARSGPLTHRATPTQETLQMNSTAVFSGTHGSRSQTERRSTASPSTSSVLSSSRPSTHGPHHVKNESDEREREAEKERNESGIQEGSSFPSRASSCPFLFPTAGFASHGETPSCDIPSPALLAAAYASMNATIPSFASSSTAHPPLEQGFLPSSATERPLLSPSFSFQVPPTPVTNSTSGVHPYQGSHGNREEGSVVWRGAPSPSSPSSTTSVSHPSRLAGGSLQKTSSVTSPSFCIRKGEKIGGKEEDGKGWKAAAGAPGIAQLFRHYHRRHPPAPPCPPRHILPYCQSEERLAALLRKKAVSQ